MNRDDFFYLGKILKTFGNEGHLLVCLDVDDPCEYKKLESVFIGVDDDRIPFFIKSLELRSRNQAILLFDDTTSAEDAEIFTGKEMFLPLSHLPKLSDNQFYYHEITGFSVTDLRLGSIGTVKSVLELPSQALLQVMKEGKEILIPITDEILQRVDRQNRELLINAPEGLIEIYL
jgi:16S rRNA processing protein RimM